MEAIHEFPGFHAHWDPHNRWQNSISDLCAACGYLPSWAVEYFTLLETLAEGDKKAKPEITLKEWMEERYGFGPLHHSANTIIDDKYVHHYPGDPDLYPYLVMKSQYGPEMAQYQSGLVSFRQSDRDEWFSTRMD